MTWKKVRMDFDPTELKPIIGARNKIIYDLDLNLKRTAGRRNQNSRRTEMENWSHKGLDQYVTVSITILKVLNLKLEQLEKTLLRKISKTVFRMGAGVKQETLRVAAALDWSDRQKKALWFQRTFQIRRIQNLSKTAVPLK